MGVEAESMVRSRRLVIYQNGALQTALRSPTLEGTVRDRGCEKTDGSGGVAS